MIKIGIIYPMEDHLHILGADSLIRRGICNTSGQFRSSRPEAQFNAGDRLPLTNRNLWDIQEPR